MRLNSPPKHNVIREVALPIEALKILEKYKEYKSEKFVCENLHLVFPRFRHGVRLNKPIRYLAVVRFLNLVKPFLSNDGITIHSFRHTFATHFFNVYGDSPVVMAELAAIMGHCDIATVQIYAKALEANRVNKMLHFSYEIPLVNSSNSSSDKTHLLMNARAEKALELAQQGFTPSQVTTILGPMIS